jgi:hypothetical protein
MLVGLLSAILYAFSVDQMVGKTTGFLVSASLSSYTQACTLQRHSYPVSFLQERAKLILWNILVFFIGFGAP